jgi:SRSO17 transposase
VENAQVAVYLGYAAPGGSTLIDREVYLPGAWTDDPERCAAAGVPAEVEFATKLTLAQRMLTRALQAKVPTCWCTADEAYGGDRQLRRDLQRNGVGYVLAVAKVTGSPPASSTARSAPTGSPPTYPAGAWNRLSAGNGSKGDRDYDWAWIAITPPTDESAGQHTLLIRRRISDGELAFYRCWSPQPVPLRVLVKVAGTRWSIETCFQTGKTSLRCVIQSAHGGCREWFRH